MPMEVTVAITISETVLNSFTDMLHTECSHEVLDRLRTGLISDRKMGGLVWADKKWFAGPIRRMSQFMESSRDAVDPLTAEDCAHFIVGIAETAALRDAVICSAVMCMEPDKYVMIACEPYKAASAQLVCNALDPAFNDAGILRRTRQGMRLVQLMGQWPGLLPEKYRTGVLAVLAYVSWWLGEPEISLGYSQECLGYDSSYNLAVIMDQAVRWGAMPAWYRESRNNKPSGKTQRQ